MPAKKPVWDAIRDEYITTHVTQRALCRKYNVTRRALNKYSVEQEWVKQREAYRARQSEVRRKTSQDVALDYKGTIYETAFRLAAQLRDLVASGNIVDMGLRPREVTGALKDIADVLAIKSDADVREQEARINKLVADAKRAEETDEGKEITVHIDGGAPGWTE